MSKTTQKSQVSTLAPASSEPKLVLNVGGWSKAIAIPDRYEGWEHVLLDVDNSQGTTDLVMDARKIILWAEAMLQYDAVYCSHNLEHYYLFDAVLVLKGMYAVLKPGGVLELRVPDLEMVARAIVGGASLYDAVPVNETETLNFDWHQCLYGCTMEILRQGEQWAHKTGFTEGTLRQLLESIGFVNCIFEHGAGYELAAMAWKPNVQEG
jgi:predicted SAM-dependent methyltransferase